MQEKPFGGRALPGPARKNYSAPPYPLAGHQGRGKDRGEKGRGEGRGVEGKGKDE